MESSIAIQDDELLVFIDETGGEDLSDPRHPVFGYAGCACLARDYRAVVSPTWEALRNAQYLARPGSPLHAARTALSASQAAAVGGFFRSVSFYRFAALVRRSTTIPEPLIPYSAVVIALVKRLRDVAGRVPSLRSMSIVLEDSERLRKPAEQHMGWPWLPLWEPWHQPVAVRWCWMSKARCEPGLEIADFVAQAAGAQSRRRETGRDPSVFRLDFQAVFHDAPRHLVSYMDANAYERVDGGPTT